MIPKQPHRRKGVSKKIIRFPLDKQNHKCYYSFRQERKDGQHVVKFDKDKEKELASMFKALSHPTRLWIVRQLVQDEHCVREFVDVLGVEFATVSRHLAKLKAAGILTSRKQGREIWYGLNRTAVSTIVAALG